MADKQTFSQETKDQFDRILDVYMDIPMDGSISLLTGRNGSGKSLVRKQLIFRARKIKPGCIVADASMERRTGLHSGLGGAGIFMRDTEWDPTSVSTLGFINTVSNSIHGGFLVLDEIEIGCGEESIMGLVAWLNENLRDRIKDTLGCMVITHSRYVVENLKYDHWFNLDGLDTADAWLNREMVPTDLDQLRKASNELFRMVLENTKKEKK